MFPTIESFFFYLAPASLFLSLTRRIAAFFHPQTVNNTGSAPGFWTTIEVSIGVVAACLPPLGPLIRKVPGPKQSYKLIRHGLSSWSQSTREVYGMEKLKEYDNTAEP